MRERVGVWVGVWLGSGCGLGARGHLEGGHAVGGILTQGEHEQWGAPVTRGDVDRGRLRAQHHLHDVLGAALRGVVQRREPLFEASST